MAELLNYEPDVNKQADGSVHGNPSAFRGEVVAACVTGAVAAAGAIARQLRSVSELSEYYRLLKIEMDTRQCRVGRG